MTKEYTLIVCTVYTRALKRPLTPLTMRTPYSSTKATVQETESPREARGPSSKSYYAASQGCSHCCGCRSGCGGCCSGGSGCGCCCGCNSTGEPPLRGERPQLQVVLCGLQPKSASETLPREFRPSDSAAATNDKTVRKNISQEEQKLKCGSES